MALEEALIHYRKADLTEEEIIAFSKKLQDNPFVKHTGDLLILPYLFSLLALVCCQCCICSLPCLWHKGCCCFKKCSNYKRKGTVNYGEDVIYICYKDYIKYGVGVGYKARRTKSGKGRIIPVEGSVP